MLIALFERAAAFDGEPSVAYASCDQRFASADD
jgi:hypothetical protein